MASVLQRPRRPVEQMAYRRKQETRVEDTVKHNAAQYNILARAKWENATDVKIVARRKGDRAAKIKAEMAESLEQRRRQLAALYNGEMAGWTTEINTNATTPEQRKEALFKRATELRDAREKQRKEFVDGCYRLQWRDACDDARTLDSVAMEKFVSTDRLEQLKEKDARKVVEKADEEVYLAQWRDRMDELEKLELAKETMRATMDKEVKGILDQQVDDLVERRLQLKEQQKEDALLEIAEWKAATDAEQAEIETRKQIAYARGREVREFNDGRFGARAQVKEQIRQQDLVLLNYALLKESQDDAKEAAKRAGEKDMMKKYQAYLEAQMIKEKEDNTAVDAQRKILENRIWEAKEREQTMQVEAREFLMKQVDEGRKAQMADARLKLEDDRIAGLREVEEYNAANAAVNKLEDDKAAMLQTMRMENMYGIKRQQAQKRVIQAREKQQEYLDSKTLVRHEKDHMEMLGKQAGSVRLYYPLQQTNWYT